MGLAGAFVPALKLDPGAVGAIISIIGAVVMPHNLYLHSGALESRRCPSVIKYKKRAVWLGLWDPFFPILSTTVVNMCIATLAAIYVYGKNVPEADSLGIASFPKYLDLKGGKTMWGVALIAAAQSSCITTTYSGQFVMDGFLKINLPMGQGNHHQVRRCRPLRHRRCRLGRHGHGAHDRRRQLLPCFLAAICSDPPDQAHNKQAVHGRQVCGRKDRDLDHLGRQPALLRDQLLHVGCAERSVLWTVHLDGYGGWRPNEHHPGSRVRLLHRLLRLHGFRPGEGISIADQAGDGRPSDRHGACSVDREEVDLRGDGIGDQPTTMKS